MKKIVTVGGGTGSYTILSGLKHIPDVEITALVSMADDGGSTGVLRDELGVLPPGDVRQCLVALSEHSDVVRKMMSYRFVEGSLSGHSFGNIFLAALEKVSGDFAQGVEIASEILKVKGKVVPITKNKAELVVTLTDGTQLFGENVLNHASIEEKGVAHIGYKESVSINEHARNAISDADVLILGPGNYFCSIVPCVITEGFREALKNTRAKIIFPVNLTNKHGHTMHWSVTDYVTSMEEYIGRAIDYVLINNEFPGEQQVEAYEIHEGDGVLVVDDYTEQNAIRAPLLSHAIIQKVDGDKIHDMRSFIRHDSGKAAEAIMNIVSKHDVKVIFDFDDVLFDTAHFKEHMFNIFEQKGYIDVKSRYQEVRSTKAPFSLTGFIALICKDADKVKHNELYEEIMAMCDELVNKDTTAFMSRLKEEDCFIVTQGDEEFQRDKIRRSLGEKYLSHTTVVASSKRESIKALCKKYEDGKVVFVDDKIEVLDDLDTLANKNLRTVLFDARGLERLKAELAL